MKFGKSHWSFDKLLTVNFLIAIDFFLREFSNKKKEPIWLLFNISSFKKLVPVMFWFIWSFNRNTQIICLIGTQNSEFYTQLFQM